MCGNCSLSDFDISTIKNRGQLEVELLMTELGIPRVGGAQIFPSWRLANRGPQLWLLTHLVNMIDFDDCVLHPTPHPPPQP